MNEVDTTNANVRVVFDPISFFLQWGILLVAMTGALGLYRLLVRVFKV